MSLGAPQFLLLVPILALAGWYFRSLALWRPLRALLLILVVITLCDPQMRLRSDSMDLWVLLDRSASATDLVASGEDEWVSLLNRSNPSRGNHIHFLNFAAEVHANTGPESGFSVRNTDETRTRLAINDALAKMKPDRHHRILLFSDGYSTEPLDGIAAKLIKAEVPLDYRLLHASESIDYQISELRLPSRSQPGEPFMVDVEINGTADGSIPLTVYRGDNALFSKEIEIKEGSGRLRFADRVTQPGAHHYRVQIDPERDAHPGNNRSEQWIEVTSGPRILLLTRYESDPLAATLKKQGFTVDVISDLYSLTPGSLSGARAVILNNVPAYELPGEFLGAIDFFVREQGGGLLMAGGKNSFGSGGYYQSDIDALLPVSMELKNEHRRLSVAMAIVMDRSGSMGMTTTSGLTKMQLANEGAARAVELLGEFDAATVFAVDSQAHEISPLVNVGKSRQALLSRVRSIESMGGGIYVYTGMNAAWQELNKAEAGQRHMILFTDASDSEEPGQYKQLIAEMREHHATVSVIGLGTRSDPDADFIQDIAHRGDGRAFFTTKPGDVPNLFAQETVSVARSTFVDEPVKTQSSGKWYEVAQRDMEWPASVDGYNLSYLREGDQMALVSQDEYVAPLIAFGRRGIGRTAAVSFPLGGDFSNQIRQWKGYADFQQTLARWLIGEQIPPGVGMRSELNGSELSIELLYDSESWSEKIATDPPTLRLSRGDDSRVLENLTWERIAPGRYSVKTRVRQSEPVRGAIQIGQHAIPFGPVVASSSLEWQFDRDRLTELEETARATGGKKILDLSQAWQRPNVIATSSIRPWFLSIALIIFLLETFVTRTGWSLPQWVPQKPKRARKKKQKARTPRPSKAEADHESPSKPEASPDPPPPPQDPNEVRRNRYLKAKKR